MRAAVHHGASPGECIEAERFCHPPGCSAGLAATNESKLLAGDSQEVQRILRRIQGRVCVMVVGEDGVVAFFAVIWL